MLQTASPTPTVAVPLPELYRRVERHIPPFEWTILADDVAAILRLKDERNAVVLAHNYQTPDIFHTVADIVGDSLALAREDRQTAEPQENCADPRSRSRLLARRLDHRC